MIGMNPYNFNSDQSKGSANLFLLLQYVIALNDLHNFWMPVEQYKSLFQEEFLDLRLPVDAEIDCVHPLPNTVIHMNLQQYMKARERIDIWQYRDFPETRDEYIKILDDYLTLCENNNVRPIMFLPPFTVGYKKHFNKKMLNEFYYLIHEAQKKHSSAIFLDGWQISFPDIDFWDTDHLNIQGAAKFSTILNNLIEELERMKN